jgi:Lon protease-like protein
MASELPAFNALPLFPLNTVLFPGGLLSLKIFEARYLDMVAACLRERTPFGVVALTRGHEVRQAGETQHFEAVGCLADLIDCDSPGTGILHIRCRGSHRFRLARPQQASDGLWEAQAECLPDDPAMAPTPAQAETVAALQRAVSALEAQGSLPFLPPMRWDDAAWVANRWCELLPIPLAARQSLMELADPTARLELVRQYLRQHQVIAD